MSNEAQHPVQQSANDDARQRSLVLVVEDEAPIAEALVLIIEDAGYRTITASHGKEALDLAREQHPDLVLTDLIAALHEDAEANGLKSVPIVLMTAAGPAHTRGANADAVLRKPFEITEIEAMLQRFLGPPSHSR